MFLTLHNGQQVEFADVELAQILIRLQAQNQSYCLGEYDTAHKSGSVAGSSSSTSLGRWGGASSRAII